MVRYSTPGYNKKRLVNIDLQGVLKLRAPNMIFLELLIPWGFEFAYAIKLLIILILTGAMCLKIA